MTLSDFEKREARGENFLADFHNYAQTVGPTATKFGVVIHVGSSVFLRSDTLQSEGAGPQLPQIFGPLPATKRFDSQRRNLVQQNWAVACF